METGKGKLVKKYIYRGWGLRSSFYCDRVIIVQGPEETYTEGSYERNILQYHSKGKGVPFKRLVHPVQ